MPRIIDIYAQSFRRYLILYTALLTTHLNEVSKEYDGRSYLLGAFVTTIHAIRTGFLFGRRN
jgi:hypothetical protein